MEFPLAAAHGREEGDFVAGMESRVPGGEFLIAGGHQRGAEVSQVGIPGGKVGKELLDRSSVGKLKRFLGVADDFLESAKEEDFDADGLRNRWHRRIVTRVWKRS